MLQKDGHERLGHMSQKDIVSQHLFETRLVGRGQDSAVNF